MESPQSLPGWASSFDDMIDKRVMTILSDGRKLVGYLRSYDQFANVLIDEAYERHVIDSLYSDVFLGVMIIRGENMALLGEVSQAESLVEVPLDVVLRRQAEAQESSNDHGGRGVNVDLGFLDDF
jgi:U6 snRNA-associated Sm-like protein LSm1